MNRTSRPTDATTTDPLRPATMTRQQRTFDAISDGPDSVPIRPATIPRPGQGATPAQERDRVESARRARDVLREQGRSPRVLVAALRLETRRTNWGVLCGPSDRERLTADFERAFLEG